MSGRLRRCHYKAMPAASKIVADIAAVFSGPALCGRRDWKYTSVHRDHVSCIDCLRILAKEALR